jgi:hypothetical protein
MISLYLLFRDCRGGDRMVVGFTTTCAVSTTKVVSSNPAHAGVYSIQHYVIKLINSTTLQLTSEEKKRQDSRKKNNRYSAKKCRSKKKKKISHFKMPTLNNDVTVNSYNNFYLFSMT